MMDEQRDNKEKIVQGVIDWLKPYLKKEYGVGCYFTDTEVKEWVICDRYGDAIDVPNYTLESEEYKMEVKNGRKD